MQRDKYDSMDSKKGDCDLCRHNEERPKIMYEWDRECQMIFNIQKRSVVHKGKATWNSHMIWWRNCESLRRGDEGPKSYHAQGCEAILHPFIRVISIAPPQVHYYTETLPTIAWILLCRNCHRQLCVKDLTKVPTWRLERESKPRPFERKASTLRMRHHASHHDSIRSGNEGNRILGIKRER